MTPKLFRDTWRLLTFRLTREEFEAFDLRHLFFGLALCWLAGIGRFWATPHVPWWAQLGLGSLIYPFVLAIPVAAILKTLGDRLGYLHAVTFISLTGPLAFIYAPIVPQWLGVEQASILRLVAMAIVSLWRVGLLTEFFRRQAGLKIGGAVAVTGMLLTGIVTTLTALNLERAVFAIMGGRLARTVSDDSYEFLILLSLISILLLPITAICSIVSVYGTARQRKMTSHLETPVTNPAS